MKKPIYFTVSLLTLLLWIFNGRAILNSQFRSQTAAEKIESKIKELEIKYPKESAMLARLSVRVDPKQLSNAITVTESYSGTPKLFVRSMRNKQFEASLQLINLGLKESLYVDSKEKASIISTHEFMFGAIGLFEYQYDIEDGLFIREYSLILEEISLKPSAWAILKNNPAAIIIWSKLKDDHQLTQFFLNEYNWLLEVVEWIDQIDNESTINMKKDFFDQTKKIVHLCKTLYPYTKKSWFSNNESGLLDFVQFFEYGDLIKECIELNISQDEIHQVISTNGDFIDTYLTKGGSPKELATQLNTIKMSKSATWQAAMREEKVLWLNNIAPQHIEAVLNKYEGFKISMFISKFYQSEATQAVSALALYGDVALVYLEMYKERSDFKLFLTDKTVGIRVIPYVAMYGGGGLANLSDNKEWINKNMNNDGNPKEKSFLTSLPFVGAGFDVCISLTKGYPITADELG